MVEKKSFCYEVGCPFAYGCEAPPESVTPDIDLSTPEDCRYFINSFDVEAAQNALREPRHYITVTLSDGTKFCGKPFSIRRGPDFSCERLVNPEGEIVTRGRRNYRSPQNALEIETIDQ